MMVLTMVDNRPTEAMKVMLKWITIIVAVLGLYMGGYFYGKSITVEQTSKEELTSIYRLLSAAAFTNRACMGLSAKTNHYITHNHKDAQWLDTNQCKECMNHIEYLVTNMPKLDRRNEAYFDIFYRRPFKDYQLQQNTQEK